MTQTQRHLLAAEINSGIHPSLPLNLSWFTKHLFDLKQNEKYPPFLKMVSDLILC